MTKFMIQGSYGNQPLWGQQTKLEKIPFLTIALNKSEELVRGTGSDTYGETEGKIQERFLVYSGGLSQT